MFKKITDLIISTYVAAVFMLSILMCFLISLSLQAAINNPSYSYRSAKFDNQAAVQDAIAIASPSRVYYGTFTAGDNIDPFGGKTNKYAESRAIMIKVDRAAHVRMAGSTVGIASSSDYYIATGSNNLFIVDTRYPYVRIYTPVPGVGQYWVTELQ
jgi:hypothetical protein